MFLKGWCHFHKLNFPYSVKTGHSACLAVSTGTCWQIVQKEQKAIKKEGKYRNGLLIPKQQKLWIQNVTERRIGGNAKYESKGIGYETAADLAKRGAKVILACRNETKAKHAQERLKKETGNQNISYKILDLCSFKSVRRFAEEINKCEERLDILINNAGLHTVPGTTFSEDGLQPVMQSNYFGHFLLTDLLLDLLQKSSPSRIVNVSSVAGSYTPLNLKELNSNKLLRHTTYGRSKLCNILFNIELNTRLKGTGVTTFSVHPGVIMSEFTRNIPAFAKVIVDFCIKWFFKDSIEGAQSTIYCAVANDIEKYSGEHFHDCHVVQKYMVARDPDLPKALWEKTEELINNKTNNY